MIDTYIGNRSDAVQLITDLLELVNADCLEIDILEAGLIALKDAIERSVV